MHIRLLIEGGQKYIQALTINAQCSLGPWREIWPGVITWVIVRMRLIMLQDLGNPRSIS